MAGNKYTPSSQVRKRISDWEGAAMHGSTIDPLSKKKVSKNNSIDNEASLFASKIPEEIRERVFSNQELADNLFSYSYNVGSHNFKKRVVPTLMNYYSGKASARDVADTMFSSGDSKLRGLQKRRDYEKSHVVSALQKNSPIYKTQPSVTPIFTPDALRVDTPYPTYVESATPVPIMVPDENSFVTAHPQTPEERSAIQFNQRMENIQRLNRLFDIADIKNIEIPQYTPRTNPYVISSYSEGGKLKKKSWDDLSMEEKSEMIGVAVRQGYTNISDIKDKYNEFAEGGDTEESHLSYGYPVYWSDEVPSKYNWAKSYLKEHSDVTGFAVGGGAQGPEDMGPRVIIRNSHSNILPDHNDSRWYGFNKIEAIRHYMDETGYVPNFETSPEQDKFRRDNFSNEDQYGRDDTAWKQSVISRITADKEIDKEFGVTPEQFRDYANIMRGLNSKMDNHYNIPNAYKGGYYLPEVTVSGNKHSIGGPLVESVMNEYKSGGSIYIKPSHRGRLTELKKRTGKTEAELYRTGSPATRKMITFARSARKWKHGLGGNLFREGGNEGSPNIFRYDDGRYVYQESPTSEEITVTPFNTTFSDPSQWTYTDADGKLYTPRASQQTYQGEINQGEAGYSISKAIDDYLKEAVYRAKDGTLALQGKYTMPAIAAASVLPLAGEAFAGTSIAGIPATTWADTTLTAGFGAHGLNHAINESIDGLGDAVMTATEIVPLGRMIKPVYEGVIQPGMRLFNSPLTGNWTKIGNREYRLSPSSLGSTGLPLESRAVPTQITTENAASIHSKVNWDADNWFKTISGRSSYSSEEATELASHIPEYRAIEQRLFDEGKLALDSNGNTIVVGSEMSPQEYIMRQSEAFQKMNPEHHYVGVSKGLRHNFENEARDPNTINRYEVWTDRKSPKNVEEYAQSQQGGYTNDSQIETIEHQIAIREENHALHKEQLKWKLDHGKISQENYDRDLTALEDMYNWKQKVAEDELKVLRQQKALDPLNGGKVFDVTYPKETIETPIINAENNHWTGIPFDNVIRDAPSVVTHYKQRPYNNKLQTDQIISAARRNGYGVTHIDNVMDTYDGTMLNETIIGRNTPIKSVLGNTGTFDIESPNKWKLYRSLLPPFIGLGTLGTMYETNQKALGGNLFDGESQPTQQMFVRDKNNHPIAFDTEGNLTDQVTGDKGIMYLPEVTITPSRYTRDLYSSAFDPNAPIEFINTITAGGLNNLSPTQWARRAYDTVGLINGDMSQEQYINSWINGNNGIVTDKFSQEHPYWSAGINMAGDALAFGLGQAVRRGSANAFYKNATADMTSQPGVYYHGSPVRDIETFVPGRTGGIFFTPSKSAARGYAGRFGNGRIYEAKLNLGDSPITIDAKGNTWTSIPEESVANAFGLTKEEILEKIGHYNAGAKPWYADYLYPFGFKFDNKKYAIDQIVKLGKNLNKSSVTIKGAKDSGKDFIFGNKNSLYDQVVVYDPKQIRLLDNMSFTPENATSITPELVPTVIGLTGYRMLNNFNYKKGEH